MAESGGSGSTNEGEVVFCRNSAIGTNDDWDDTALIEAYDNAVGGIYRELKKRKAHKNDIGVAKWKIGALCRAQYTDDEMWYEAKIISLDDDSCTVQYLGYGNEEEKTLSSLRPSNGKESRRQQIVVAKEVDGCDRNMETCHSDDDSAKPNAEFKGIADDKILPSTSGLFATAHCDTREEQPQQRDRSSRDNERRKRGAFFKDGTSGIAFPPPPPPFPPAVDELCGSDEALAAMLMSWYISGYHTGYYQAMRQSGKS